MGKKIVRLMGILALFLGGWLPTSGRAGSTAFDIIPGWLMTPGVNAQAIMGYEFAQFDDFGKGISTEILRLKDTVGIRYGFLQGVTKPWYSHNLGFSIPIVKLAEQGFKITLPPFLQASEIYFALGTTRVNNVPLTTFSVNIIVLGGGI